MSKKAANIAIYGGTFDPFHNGHLRMAIEAREILGLDTVFLIPSANPPHKPLQPMADAKHRLEMVRAAVAEVAGLEVLDLELRRVGPSYSFQTVTEIKKDRPEAEILFLIGADAFSEITSWHRWRDLLTECDFLLLPRIVAPPELPFRPELSFPPGVQLEPEESRCYSLGKIAEGLKYKVSLSDNTEGSSYRLPGGRRVLCPRLPVLDISSRSIREKVKLGKSIRGLVAPEVERYIAEHGLYSD